MLQVLKRYYGNVKVNRGWNGSRQWMSMVLSPLHASCQASMIWQTLWTSLDSRYLYSLGYALNPGKRVTCLFSDFCPLIHIYIHLCVCVCGMRVGTQVLKALCILDKHSVTELHPSPHYRVIVMEKGHHNVSHRSWFSLPTVATTKTPPPFFLIPSLKNISCYLQTYGDQRKGHRATEVSLQFFFFSLHHTYCEECKKCSKIRREGEKGPHIIRYVWYTLQVLLATTPLIIPGKKKFSPSFCFL